MNKIETKVAARNEVNTIARAYTAKCRLALAPFIGKKILLSSGGNSAKFTAAAGALNLPISCYISTGHGYSVTANFRVAKTSDAGTFYAEATLYLFDIDRAGVMVANPAYDSHVDADHYRTDFDAESIVYARGAVAAARAALQIAERNLCSFGEND